MNYYQAQELLTAVKHGRPTRLIEINMALYLTGDLCGALCSDGTDCGGDRPCEIHGATDGERRDWAMDWIGQVSGEKNQGDQRC